MKILSGAEGKWQENTSTQEPTVSALHVALGQILVQRKQQTNKNIPRKVLFFEEKLNKLWENLKSSEEKHERQNQLLVTLF